MQRNDSNHGQVIKRECIHGKDKFVHYFKNWGSIASGKEPIVYIDTNEPESKEFSESSLKPEFQIKGNNKKMRSFWLRVLPKIGCTNSADMFRISCFVVEDKTAFLRDELVSKCLQEAETNPQTEQKDTDKMTTCMESIVKHYQGEGWLTKIKSEEVKSEETKSKDQIKLEEALKLHIKICEFDRLFNRIVEVAALEKEVKTTTNLPKEFKELYAKYNAFKHYEKDVKDGIQYKDVWSKLQTAFGQCNDLDKLGLASSDLPNFLSELEKHFNQRATYEKEHPEKVYIKPFICPLTDYYQRLESHDAATKRKIDRELEVSRSRHTSAPTTPRHNEKSPTTPRAQQIASQHTEESKVKVKRTLPFEFPTLGNVISNNPLVYLPFAPANVLMTGLAEANLRGVASYIRWLSSKSLPAKIAGGVVGIIPGATGLALFLGAVGTKIASETGIFIVNAPVAGYNVYQRYRRHKQEKKDNEIRRKFREAIAKAEEEKKAAARKAAEVKPEDSKLMQARPGFSPEVSLVGKPASRLRPATPLPPLRIRNNRSPNDASPPLSPSTPVAVLRALSTPKMKRSRENSENKNSPVNEVVLPLPGVVPEVDKPLLINPNLPVIENTSSNDSGTPSPETQSPGSNPSQRPRYFKTGEPQPSGHRTGHRRGSTMTYFRDGDPVVAITPATQTPTKDGVILKFGALRQAIGS